MKTILTRDFLALILSVAVVGLGSGATFPLTALALTQAGHGADIVGLLTAAQAGGGLLVVPLAGRITRRFASRQVIVATVLVVACATALTQFTTHLAVWAVLRVLCGAALMLLFTIGETWVNQLANDATRGRVVAVYTTNYTLFQMAGPVLVSQIAEFSAWRFLLCGAIFLLALPALTMIRTAPIIRDDSNGRTEPDRSSDWQHVLPRMPSLIAGTAFFALFDTLVLSLLPLFAMAHGVSSEIAVLFASAILFGDTAMQFPFGWLADRFGRERVHVGAGIAVIALLPVLPWAIDIAWLRWPVLFVLGAAAGSIYSLSIVACGERFRGAALVSASSLVGASWSVASFGGPLIAGTLMRGLGANALIGVLLASALAFLVAALWERRQQPTHDLNRHEQKSLYESD
jgi:MFS family permease